MIDVSTMVFAMTTTTMMAVTVYVTMRNRERWTSSSVAVIISVTYLMIKDKLKKLWCAMLPTPSHTPEAHYDDESDCYYLWYYIEDSLYCMMMPRRAMIEGRKYRYTDENGQLVDLGDIEGPFQNFHGCPITPHDLDLKELHKLDVNDPLKEPIIVSCHQQILKSE